MTDNEIIKALKSEIHLAKYVDSSYCDGVNVPLLEATLDLINHQKEKIERLENEVFAKEQECVDMQEQRDSVEKHLETARAEAVKEFAERLKETPIKCAYPLLGLSTRKEITEHFNDITMQVRDAIDNLVKEMTEQRKEET